MLFCALWRLDRLCRGERVSVENHVDADFMWRRASIGGRWSLITEILWHRENSREADEASFKHYPTVPFFFASYVAIISSKE